MEEGEGNEASYLEHIGLFFFFVACAGVSIVVWIFNWICWYNKCCCCDFLHNPVNKRLVWWTCFIFLLGILACCISGFVTVNRFGFALEGSWCSFDRFYYDSLNGQLKEIYPKWEGFGTLNNYLDQLIKFYSGIKGSNIDEDDLFINWNKSNIEGYKYEGYYSNYFLNNITELNSHISQQDDVKKLIKEIFQNIIPITSKYGKILNSIYNIKYLEFPENSDLNALNKNFSNLKTNFPGFKSTFLDKFYYYAKVANGCGKILTMIYFCLLLIATTFAGVSMMFYACLKNQGYLSIFMHVLWNIIRFFMFSFFFYGAAYGMCYLALRDAVAYVMFIFGEDNLKLNQKSYLITNNNDVKDYFNFCLINTDSDYKNKLDSTLRGSLNDFFLNYKELSTIFDNYQIRRDISQYETKINDEYKKSLNNIITSQAGMLESIKTLIKDSFCTDNICGSFPDIALREGGIFGSFNCTFLKSDLSMMYRTLYDLSIEARILCALSCCIGFFGAIAVYFFLLVLHHYDNEIFYDNNNSKFIGFKGVGNKKKYSNKDPAYKKRKIRSEIELSSRNEEYSGYQPGN